VTPVSLLRVASSVHARASRHAAPPRSPTRAGAAPTEQARRPTAMEAYLVRVRFGLGLGLGLGLAYGLVRVRVRVRVRVSSGSGQRKAYPRKPSRKKSVISSSARPTICCTASTCTGWTAKSSAAATGTN
jgi:hypothetical protein